MKKFNAGALMIVIVAQIVLSLTTTLLVMTSISYEIVDAIKIVTTLITLIGISILAKEYNKEFKFAKNMAIINFMLAIPPVMLFVISMAITAFSSVFGHEGIANIIIAITFCLDALFLSAVAKGVYNLLNQAGVKGLSRLYSVIASTCVVIMFSGSLMAEIVLLIITGAMGIILKGRLVVPEYKNSSYNPIIKDEFHNMQDRVGKSTRDEVYKQFEG